MARPRILGGGGASPSQTVGRPGFGKFLKSAINPRGVYAKDPNRNKSVNRLIAVDPAGKSALIGTAQDIPGLYRPDFLVTALVGADNDLRFTAKNFETTDITIAYVAGGGATVVTVATHAITVAVKTSDGVAATSTLTSDNTNVADGATVVINGRTYTFKTTLTASTTADQVLIGSDADDSLLNLKKAINLEAGSGTKYGSLTTLNADVSCGAVTAHAVVLTAKIAGTDGNAITVTESSTHLSFSGSGTMASGAQGSTLTGTAQSVMDAVNAHAVAGGLVHASWAPDNYGSGVVTLLTATGLSGVLTPPNIGPDSAGSPSVVGGFGVSKGVGNAGTSDNRQKVTNRSSNRTLRKR